MNFRYNRQAKPCDNEFLQECSLLVLLYIEYGGTAIIQNADNHLPVDML
jgi:hypothetical protein